MAIGGNSQNTPNTFTTRSRYKFYSEGELNFTMLDVSYWNGLFAISIIPCTKDSSNNKIDVQFKNKVSIYLTPIKCKAFLEGIKQFISGAYKNVGVTSSNSIVTISDGSDFNVDKNVLCIREFDKETNNLKCSLTYEFNSNRGFIGNYQESGTLDGSDLNMIYENSNIIELITIREALNDFSRYANGAQAYWNKFIFEKDKSYSNNKTNFNNNNSNSNNTSSFNDIDQDDLNEFDV